MRRETGDTVKLLLSFHHLRLTISPSAKDYVEGMWRMLQQPTPDDFVLATGETHPVREFVEKSFQVVGVTIKYASRSLSCVVPEAFLTYRWRNTGEQEEGYDGQTGRVVVKVDPQYFRPAEVEYVCHITFLSTSTYPLYAAFSSETRLKPSVSLDGSARSTLTHS